MSVSQELGRMLLGGWTMMQDTCPQCLVVPLMMKDGKYFCVGCNTDTTRTIKQEQGHSIKQEQGHTIKQEEGHTVKQEQGHTNKEKEGPAAGPAIKDKHGNHKENEAFIKKSNDLESVLWDRIHFLKDKLRNVDDYETIGRIASAINTCLQAVRQLE
jgi:uncharacterized Zn finger protein (UPF0148 family)